MRKIYFLLVACLSALFACKTTQKTTSTKKTQEPILMYVGDMPITVGEFKYVYEKNNPNKDSLYVEKSLRDYLDLYTKFKLKVLDGIKNGIDTTREFQTEYYGYEVQLVRPYLIPKEVTDKLVREAYDRMQEEINASHILIRVSPEADPKDTLTAYEKIKKIRERALKGESFEKLAQDFSEDPSGSANGGNLGYFTGLKMVYPFETAAYKTPKGQISDIVRTEFGYHIIKVLDRRPTSGKVTAAHIMLRTAKGISAEDSIALRKKAFEIYERAKKGEEWGKLVAQFSEDANTKNSNGQLREFGVGDLIPEFENAAFALKNPGEISEPVLSPYGWHIIKLISKGRKETFEEVETSIRNRVQRDSRSEVSKSLVLARLRKENNLKINDKVLKKAISAVDSSLLRGNWDFKEDKFLKEIIANFENKQVGKKQNISVRDFYFYLKTRQQQRPDLKDAKHYANLLWQRFIDDETVNFEKSILPDKFYDYKMLAQEYREGMILFAMMNDKVWAKAIKDTTGAKQFYEKNKEKYRWGERAFATIFDAANENILKQVEEYAGEKPPYLLKGYFENNIIKYGKDQMKYDEKEYLGLINEVGEALNKDANLLLEISGHMDKTERPKTLSADRTKVIFDYLYQIKRINANQAIRKDFGSSMPGTKKNPKPNSRVELQMYSYALSGIEKVINKSNALNLKVTELKPYEKGTNDLLNAVPWKEGKHRLQRNGRYFLVHISSIEAPRTKTFEEARGNIIQDYQVFLEKEWIDELQKKYPVKIQEEEFKKLVKK
ncbi:peptidylprolyl isomerase [Raineya orbicola]|jgi:peptidyl-prolyl cis-trans isomerase SurA|uniref:PPIC-type PPIASE domain n=1 Tax=Raineya orbicola TaxID=2016530 RepID=A0A2N3II06_9BACT|nr:peptidylprolyl isomerase [Raineya orbicola]PKQ69962.1 PPIC-type PPIASE domain [Raineya orbicola]